MRIVLEIMGLVFIDDIVITIIEISLVFVRIRMVEAAVSFFVEACCSIWRNLHIFMVSVCVWVVSTSNFIPAFLSSTGDLMSVFLFFMGIEIVDDFFIGIEAAVVFFIVGIVCCWRLMMWGEMEGFIHIFCLLWLLWCPLLRYLHIIWSIDIAVILALVLILIGIDIGVKFGMH